MLPRAWHRIACAAVCSMPSGVPGPASAQGLDNNAVMCAKTCGQLGAAAVQKSLSAVIVSSWRGGEVGIGGGVDEGRAGCKKGWMRGRVRTHLMQACVHLSTGLGAYQAGHLAAVPTEHFSCLVKDTHLQPTTTLLAQDNQDDMSLMSV